MDNFYIKDFGAKGDGITLDTEAIQSAINACHLNRGGYVILESGEFISGTLYLKDNVFLKVNASAKLYASPNINDYGNDTHYNRYINEKDLDRCFIYAEDAYNIGIIGDGEINGQAEFFPNPESIYRPMMIRLLRCSHIYINGLKLFQAASWTTAFLDSENIWVDGLHIYNDKRYNGDGLDFDGCKNVFVSNCKILGTDDNFCLQASSKDYPAKNIQVTNCQFTSICAAVRIGLKSIGDISNVTITGCTFENVWREGIKIECTEGGNITDIVIQGNVMKNVTRPIFVILNNRLDIIGSSIGLKEMPAIGSLKRIQICDLIATDDVEMENTHWRFSDDIMGCPKFNGIRIDAEEKHPIETLILKNIVYTFIGGVKKEEVPEEYPKVLDLRKGDKGKTSENYYPDWSRATFMDIRNVNYLLLEGILLHAIKEDTRPSYYIEQCSIVKKEIMEY